MRPQAVKTALTKRLMAILLAVVALAAVTGSLGRLAPAAAEGTASVSILHAVPGVTVDVYANGAKVVGNFKPGTLTSPQKLPAGKYDLKIVKAGAGAGGTALAQASATVPAGANITVVAHLSAAGKPELTPYVNTVSAIPAGQARRRAPARPISGAWPGSATRPRAPSGPSLAGHGRR